MGVFFRQKTFSFKLFIYCALIVKDRKILLKISRKDFLIEKWDGLFCELFSFRVCAYQIMCWIFDFSLTFFYCKKRIFPLFFSVALDVSFVTIIFTMFFFWGHKKAPPGVWDPSTHNQLLSIHKHNSHMNSLLSILEQNQRNASMNKNFVLSLQKFISGNTSVFLESQECSVNTIVN